VVGREDYSGRSEGGGCCGFSGHCRGKKTNLSVFPSTHTNIHTHIYICRVACYRRFVTTCLSHIQGQASPSRMPEWMDDWINTLGGGGGWQEQLAADQYNTSPPQSYSSAHTLRLENVLNGYDSTYTYTNFWQLERTPRTVFCLPAPCYDNRLSCILSFGWFPGVWTVYADVSEQSVCPVFIDGVSTKTLHHQWRWNRQIVPKRRHIKFRRRRITETKEYDVQNTVKVWNQE